MNVLNYSILFLFTAIVNIFSIFGNHTDEECSAINAFVAITEPDILRTTLLSAQALFPPYTYSLESTEVVTLADEDNNACVNSSDSITTDVTDKVVVVWRGNGDCSEHSKVNILQAAGAVAVLIANNENGNYVETVADDNDETTETTIPARMITEEDGYLIEDYVSSGSSNGTLLIEIGCLDTEYPSVICIEDYSGEVWYLDGDYEQEASDILEVNSHPVYIKEAYYSVVGTLYMFLYDNDGDNDWHWVIAWDYDISESNKYDYIEAYCLNASIVDPADCGAWKTLDDTDSEADENGFVLNTAFDVSDELCALAESYICIESDLAVGGLTGTYKLITEGFGLWMRELSTRDSSPGYLLYGYYHTTSGCNRGRGGGRGCYKYAWFLYDSVDGSAMAYCTLGVTDDVDEEYPSDVEFMPWICDEWEVVADSSVIDGDYDVDDSFSVSNESCSDYTTAITDSSTVDDVSDSMCMQDHSLLHSFLEGTYVMLDGVTTPSGRHVWYLPRNEDTDHPAYLYYLGDYDDDEQWWVISPYDPTNNTRYRYAYCAADVSDPINCDGCWYFYYGASGYGDYDADCEVDLLAGECAATTTMAPVTADGLDDYYPPLLCLEFSRFYTYTNTYSGTYERSDEYGVEESMIDGRYFWIQITDGNGNSLDSDDDSVYYIYYDSLFKYWIWSNELGVDGNDADVFCTESNLYNPGECETWYDVSGYVSGYGSGYENTVNVDISEQECDSSRSSSGKSSSSSASAGETAAWVIVVIVLILLIFGGLWYYRSVAKRNQANQAVSFRENNNNNNNRPKHAAQKSDLIELGTDGGGVTGGATGGYNMETLNNEDVGENVADEDALPEYNTSNDGPKKATGKHAAQPSDLIELGDGDLPTGAN